MTNQQPPKSSWVAAAGKSLQLLWHKARHLRHSQVEASRRFSGRLAMESLKQS